MEFLEEYCNQIKQAGKELYSKSMPELTEELFAIYERTGNRSIYEEVYFLRRKYLVTFGMLSILDGGEEWIKKLEEVIVEVCKEECWALPAHVDRKNNKDWRITVELFASETAQALAELISVLGEKLRKEVRDRAKKEIFRRVLTPFITSQGEYDWWEHSTLNWCAVCNGAIGSALIYLLQEDPETLEQSLLRICHSLTYYIDGFSEDGACMEGVGYFTYGMTYFTGFAKQLYDYSKGKLDLFQNDKVKRIASFQEKCYFSNGSTLSFSDGSSKERFSMGLTSFLSNWYESVHIPEVSLAAEFGYDPCFRWMGCYRDYLWTAEYYNEKNRSTAVTATTPTIFKDAQWFICESENGCGIAIKGGDNDEPHNHNDVGSFLYFRENEIFLPDLGAGEYTRDYFHEKRYEIFCNSSFSHSVPVINEKPQLAGIEHRCKEFQAEEDGQVVMDITDAYEKGSVDKLLRTITFDRINGEVTIEDSFVINENTKCVRESFISYLNPVVESNAFLLQGKKESVRIVVDGSGLSVKEVDHAEHDGSHRIIYQMSFEVSLNKGKSRIQIKSADRK